MEWMPVTFKLHLETVQTARLEMLRKRYECAALICIDCYCKIVKQWCAMVWTWTGFRCFFKARLLWNYLSMFNYSFRPFCGTYIYIIIYIYYVSIYIYILCKYVVTWYASIFTYGYTYIVCVYIMYIIIYYILLVEREREQKKRDKWMSLFWTSPWVLQRWRCVSWHRVRLLQSLTTAMQGQTANAGNKALAAKVTQG